jgi:hypothetical protein
MKWRYTTLVVTGVAAIGAAAVLVALPTSSTTADLPVAAQETEVAPALNGAFSAVDPEGTFGRPNAAQSRKIARELGRTLARHAPSNAATAERFRDDGVISKVMPLEHLNFSVARIGADGKIARDCTHGVDETADFLGAAAPVAKTPATPEEM